MLISTVLSVLLFHGDPGCHLVEKRELSAAVSGFSCVTQISRSLSFFKVVISLSCSKLWFTFSKSCDFPFFLPPSSELIFLFLGAPPLLDGVANHAWKTSDMALVITLLGPGMENT